MKRVDGVDIQLHIATSDVEGSVFSPSTPNLVAVTFPPPLHDDGRGILATYPLPDGEFQLNAAMRLHGKIGGVPQNYFDVTPGGILELPHWPRNFTQNWRREVPVIAGESKLRVLQHGEPALLMQLLDTKSGTEPNEVGSNCVAVWIDQETSQSVGEAGKKTGQAK